ncbi:MAG: carboxypeptidase-like regulatory domain-containing protein, partial [Fidelibacterota bacterium]
MGDSTPATGVATFSGYVLNGETGEGLPGANVYFLGTEFGTATSVDGYFVLPNIPPGSYTLEISYLGYETVRTTVDLQPHEKLKDNFDLSPQPVELEAVEVSGERLDRKVNMQMSRVKLNVRQLKGVPQLVEPDLFRTLQSLPGILTETEFSTGLVIRGGNTDQNLILLDGITVYNPSHLGGVFSSFILDAVKEADLYKGGFNAEYGGRLSAVLSVRSREGNQKEFDGKATISLISAQTTLEGPMGKGAWLLSARRTYFDQVFRGTKLYIPYYFYDVQGHIFQDFTERDRVAFSWYLGSDDLSWDEFQLRSRWGNRTFSGHYRKLFNEKLVSNWLLAKSRFDIFFGLGGASGIDETDFVDDVTFRSDWTYFSSHETQLRFGLELKDLSFVYFNTFLDSTLFDARQSPLEGAIYGKVKRWLSPVFMVEPGLRITYYEGHPQKWYLDPRLGLKYLVTPDRYLNASVGLYHQFMGTVQDDYYPKILDAWFAVDSSVKPGSSVQYILGYEAYFGGAYHAQIEGYFKTLKNMMTFVDPRSTVDEIVSDETLDDLVDLGDGYAYGWEFFFHKEFGRLNGWLAYSYSVARKKLHGAEYFTNWDRRHAFNVVANYRLTRKWDTNLKWTYQTG